MDHVLAEAPCLLYETFAMMSRYFNERPYRETADILLERYGGVLSDADRAALSRNADMLDRITNELCADLDRGEPEIAFFFKPFDTGRRGEVNCIGRVLLFSLMSTLIPDFDEHIADIKARHEKAVADGARVVDFNAAGVYWSTSAEGPCPSLFEQIYALHYPAEAKLNTFRVLSDFDRFIDRLAELMRPYAQRLSERLPELLPAYGEAARAWRDRVEENGLVYFSQLLHLTEPAFDRAGSLDINVGIFLFNEVGFGNSPSPDRLSLVLIIGIGVYPGFERGYNERRAEKLAEVFRLLADPAKLDLLSRLAKQRSYCLELSKQTGVNAGNVSRSLNALFDSGLLEKQRVGGRTYYTTNEKALKKAFIDAELLISDPEI